MDNDAVDVLNIVFIIGASGAFSYVVSRAYKYIKKVNSAIKEFVEHYEEFNGNIQRTKENIIKGNYNTALRELSEGKQKISDLAQKYDGILDAGCITITKEFNELEKIILQKI